MLAYYFQAVMTTFKTEIKNWRVKYTILAYEETSNKCMFSLFYNNEYMIDNANANHENIQMYSFLIHHFLIGQSSHDGFMVNEVSSCTLNLLKLLRCCWFIHCDEKE